MKIGTTVEKSKGYRYPGIIIGVVNKLNGQVRYVVECTAKGAEGMLHIFNESQLRITK